MHNKIGEASTPSSSIRWFWPALLSLLAFSANSVFCRQALASGAIDPHSFTAIRLFSGAVLLLLLVKVRQPRQALGGGRRGALALFVYAWLFSIAYLQLGAGVGALILFGAVQISMFLVGWLRGEALRLPVLCGMLLAFAGLVALLAPGKQAPPLGSALLMVIAGVAWGAYSLIGKGSTQPLADTAGNFVYSLLLLPMLALAVWIEGSLHLQVSGVAYALASGVLASGAGYALWYGVVRQISAQQAATLQLTVPVMAALAGVLLLGEPLSLRLVVISLVVLGGVGLALLPAKPATG